MLMFPNRLGCRILPFELRHSSANRMIRNNNRACATIGFPNVGNWRSDRNRRVRSVDRYVIIGRVVFRVARLFEQSVGRDRKALIKQHRLNLLEAVTEVFVSQSDQWKMAVWGLRNFRRQQSTVSTNYMTRPQRVNKKANWMDVEKSHPGGVTGAEYKPYIKNIGYTIYVMG